MLLGPRELELVLSAWAAAPAPPLTAAWGARQGLPTSISAPLPSLSCLQLEAELGFLKRLLTGGTPRGAPPAAAAACEPQALSSASQCYFDADSGESACVGCRVPIPTGAGFRRWLTAMALSLPSCSCSPGRCGGRPRCGGLWRGRHQPGPRAAAPRRQGGGGRRAGRRGGHAGALPGRLKWMVGGAGRHLSSLA